MKLSLFKPKANLISVPDIKEYLVSEYEKVNYLRQENERLEGVIENAREVMLKYDAAMVTLDEYKKRLERTEALLSAEKLRVSKAREEAAADRDELNSYKIKFNSIAITKEEIKEEVREEVIGAFTEEIITKINEHKGKLSKNAACKLILGEEVLPAEGEPEDE